MKFFLIDQYSNQYKKLGGGAMACLFLVTSFLTVNTYAQIRESGMFRVDNSSVKLSVKEKQQQANDTNSICDPSWLAEVTSEELQRRSNPLYSLINGVRRITRHELNKHCMDQDQTPFYLAIRAGLSFAVIETMLEMGAKVQNDFFEHTALDIHRSSNLEHPEYQEISELLLVAQFREEEELIRRERILSGMCPPPLRLTYNRRGDPVCRKH